MRLNISWNSNCFKSAFVDQQFDQPSLKYICNALMTGLAYEDCGPFRKTNKKHENCSVIPRLPFLLDHRSDLIKQRRVLIVCVLWAVDEWAVGRSWKFQSKFFLNYSGERRPSLRSPVWALHNSGHAENYYTTPGTKTIIRQLTNIWREKRSCCWFPSSWTT